MIDFNYTAPELLPYRIQEVLDAPTEPHRIGGVVYVPEDGGECECVWNVQEGTFRCSSCDTLLTNEVSIASHKVTPITLPNYCPNCGAKVRKAVKR